MKFEEVCARDLMTSKVVTIERTETLRNAVRCMSEHDIHSLLIPPIHPRGGYSILTGKDCIEVICNVGNEALDELCVEDAMTSPALTVAADACAAECIQLMRNSGVRTVPVLDGKKLLGILSFTDILRAVA